MASKGYQDDYRYARRLAEVAAGSYGKRRAEQILYLHGIDRETSAEVLDEVYSREDRETEKIDEILRKLTKGSALNDPAAKQKIYAKLARRGYDSAAIASALSRYEPDGKDEFL
jgi:SOS response regulatory protein OraA/RecX